VGEDRRGVWYGVGAYLLWGIFPLYFRLLEPAPALEILAHRIVWTLVFVGALLLLRRRWAWLGALARDRRRLLILFVAATVLAINWGVYVWAVNADHVVEAALGYYINPLVTVLLGVVLLRERLRTAQWVAVGLAAVAVVVLTFGLGRLPWIALVLAFSFATYGLMKNRVGMPALESLSVESALLFVPAVVVVAAYQVSGTATFGAVPHVTVLLLAAGVVTAIPLLMFAGAAARIPLTTLGLLQYLTPTAQFLIGVLVFGEAMSTVRWVGFALVWLALVVFTVDSLRAGRQRAAAAAARTDAASVEAPV
jgi:chloramphenicol-sensitive protein RarD